MDQEMKEYLDRRLIPLATKDDIEKIRQETNANFRKWKEESKSQAAEWRQEIKGDLEPLTKSKGLEPDAFQETMKDGLVRIRVETQSALDQLKLTMDSFLQRMKETGEAQAIHSREGMDKFQEQMKKLSEDMVALEEKIREGFAGVKDELGSMIKFSYSDLEKKMAALEARVKSLEKMVLP